ncbi:MAG: hypothetical protein IJ225_06295 [Solobacterium sp.]|nr:hypothetical protein [Solobacterium sp.]
MNVIVAILIAAALLGLNAWLYVANKNTPVPEGCESLKPDCAGCGITDCAVRIRQNDREENE